MNKALSNKLIQVATLAVLGSLAAASADAAVVLGDARYQVGMGFGGAGFSPNAPGEYFFLGTTAKLVTSPVVILDASAHGGPNDQVGSSDVTIWYNWIVEGGVDGTVVPILVDVYSSVDASNGDDHSDSNALATIDIRSTIDSTGSILVNCAFGQGVLGNCANEFSQTLRINAVNGQSASVMLDANSRARGAGFAHVYLDPHFYVDPSFANADQYTIRLSAGVGNGLPVTSTDLPEPSSLMLGCLALAGLAATRGRKQ